MRKKSLILYRRVQRVHRLTNHKQERNMIHLYKSAGKDSANVRKAIKEVIKKCDVCQRTRRSQGHQKFTFPKSSSFNEIIAIDLKEINGVHILWMICSFTRYAKGVVLKSKEASEVVKGLYFGWFFIFGGPSRGLWSDNGKEFKNAKVSEFCRMWNININFGAPYSPFSNGLNERNHFLCDKIIQKLMMEN